MRLLSAVNGGPASYLSVVGCDDKRSIPTGVDGGGNQLLLLFDPHTGPLEHRHTQTLNLGNRYIKVSLVPLLKRVTVFSSEPMCWNKS